MERVYKSNIIYNIKGAINNYYDLENKCMLDKGRNGDVLPSDRSMLLRDVIELCLYTKYTNMECKYYLTSPGVILGNLSEVIFNKTGQVVNDMTCRNKVSYCKKKLTNDLGSDIIIKILDKRLPDLSEYIEKVANIRIKYMDFSLNEVYAIDLDMIQPNINKVPYEDIKKVLDKLDVYSRKSVNSLLNDDEKKILGYIKYLSISNTSDEDEIKVKNYLRSISK